jgi:hypothetical protein
MGAETGSFIHLFYYSYVFDGPIKSEVYNYTQRNDPVKKKN